jgi:hypothetical protein
MATPFQTSFQQRAIKFILGAWEEVFRTSNLVVTQSKLYGFLGIQLIENPNIHQIIESMGVMSVMLDKVMSSMGSPGTDLGHDSIRLLLNAKAQIVRLEAVAAALIAGDEVLYETAVQKLQDQAAF